MESILLRLEFPYKIFFQEVLTGLRDEDQFLLVTVLRSGEERGENSSMNLNR